MEIETIQVIINIVLIILIANEGRKIKLYKRKLYIVEH